MLPCSGTSASSELSGLVAVIISTACTRCLLEKALQTCKVPIFIVFMVFKIPTIAISTCGLTSGQNFTDSKG